MKLRKLFRGTSADSLLLTAVKLVTIVLSFTVTRLLSEHLSAYDYGTYSQILLIVSTVSSLTILGMIDGLHYFYSNNADPRQRERYVSTVFALECIVSTLAGAVVMLLPLLVSFENAAAKKLLIFAALLPLFQNLISMLQVLLVSVGKAKLLALRNLAVALLRLAAVILVVTFVENVAIILVTTLAMDVAQVVLFVAVLRRNRCRIRPCSVDFSLVKPILRYCIPMGLYIMVYALNRDLDKYYITWMNDTETLALYANASKMLPFDIIMGSFCTLLQPRINRAIAAGDRAGARELYRKFIEIAYVSTTVLCFAVLAAGKQAMQLLYTEKYLAGLPIFCVYILVDLLRFSNYTMVIAAAGKTRRLLLMGVICVACNALLNVLLYRFFGILGPALATLTVTAALGLAILHFSARELDTRLWKLFDLKYFLLFMGENLLALPLFWLLARQLERWGLHYMLILLLVCGLYCALMLLLHLKRLLSTFRQVNRLTK